MDLLTLSAIAVGLALDAFAVSVTCGLAFVRREHKRALRIALSFGAFQAGMPLLGWFIGLGLRGVLDKIDHWLAFALLTVVGLHMILEALK